MDPNFLSVNFAPLKNMCSSHQNRFQEPLNPLSLRKMIFLLDFGSPLKRFFQILPKMIAFDQQSQHASNLSHRMSFNSFHQRNLQFFSFSLISAFSKRHHPIFPIVLFHPTSSSRNSVISSYSLMGPNRTWSLSRRSSLPLRSMLAEKDQKK